MFTTIVLGLLVVLAIVSFILIRTFRKIAHRTSDDDYLQAATAAKAVGFLLIGLFVICALFSFTFQVGAKHYGVLTTFGKPSHTDYGPGIHFKMPWEKDISVDGKVKTFGFTNDTNKDDTKGFDEQYPCIPTVIGNGTPTCVNVTVRWQVAEDQASVLYANYGTDDPTDHFGQAVIHAQMLATVPIVMQGYNPIAQLQVLKGQATAASAATASFAPDYAKLSDQAKALLQSRVNGEATIQAVSISSAPLDSVTQAKLSQFNQEQAKSRTALQAIITNTAQATANKKLEASLEKAPGLLTKQCLDELSDAITSKYALPAGFSCFGGSSVVIPGTK